MAPTYRQPSAEINIPEAGDINANLRNSKDLSIKTNPNAYSLELAKALKNYQEQAALEAQQKQAMAQAALQAANEAYGIAKDTPIQTDYSPLYRWADAMTGSKFSYNYAAPKNENPALDLAESYQKQGIGDLQDLSKMRSDAAGVSVKAALEKAKATMGMDTKTLDILAKYAQAMNSPKGSGATSAPKILPASELDKIASSKALINEVDSAIQDIYGFKSNLGEVGSLPSALSSTKAGRWLTQGITSAAGAFGKEDALPDLIKNSAEIGNKRDILDSKIKKLTTVIAKGIQKEVLSNADMARWEAIIPTLWSNPDAAMEILHEFNMDIRNKINLSLATYGEGGYSTGTIQPATAPAMPQPRSTKKSYANPVGFQHRETPTFKANSAAQKKPASKAAKDLINSMF